MTVIRRNTARMVLVGPVLDADGVAKTNETVANIRITKNGTVASAHGSTTLTHHHAGKYLLAMDAADSDAPGVMQASLSSGTNDMPVMSFNVVEDSIFDALFAVSAAGFDGNQRIAVGKWLSQAVTLSSTTLKPEVDQFSISDDATAADNSELQYDGTGLNGGTFPSTQSQVSQIGSGGGAANNEFVIAAPNGFVITTGSGEVNDEDATVAGGGTVHQISDTAGTMDVYYLFDIGGSFTPRNIVHDGRMNGNNQDVNVMVNTNTQASPTWVQRATLEGSALTTNIRRTWPLAAGDLMVGADAGKVAVRFQNTGLSSGTLTTDQILVEKGSIASLVGYANGQVWVDTASGTAGIVVDVNGVADEPVLTWADALTIATAKGLSDFHILNGSTIALTGTSDNFSLFGDNWTLVLADRSVAGAYFQGAHVSGVGTSTTEVHYQGCDIATMSVQIGHFDFCTFSGTVTQTLAGDYNYHDCKSKVPGPNGPTFAKTAGQAITAQWRGWKGSINLTGLEVGDTLTIGGVEIGTIDLGSPAGAVVVEIRGIYKDLVNIGSASVNLDGAINAADVALILGDTNELQQDDIPGVLGTPIALDGAAATLAAMLTKMADDNGGADFDAELHSQKGIIERGNSAWITASGFSTHTAAAVWAVVSRVLTAATNLENLSAAESQTAATAALVALNLDHLMKTAVANNADMTVEVIDGTVLSNMMSKTSDTSTFVISTDSLEGNRDASLTAAQVNAQVVDVIRTDTVSELAAVPAASPNLHSMIQFVYMESRNKRTSTATASTINDDAGSAIGTSVDSDVAGTFTRGKHT